jgi:cytochrome c oxidase subunit 1
MPRRYAEYPAEYQVLNVMSTAGSSILALGYLLPAVYLLPSLWVGRPASRSPWGAEGLEWETESPPTTENFDAIPIVPDEVYPYPYRQERHVVG